MARTYIIAGVCVTETGVRSECLAPGIYLSETDINSTVVVASSLACSSPVIGAPVLGQKHVLSAASITVLSPTIASGTFSQNHVLSANALVVSSVVFGGPVLGQKHVIASVSYVDSSPAIGVPVVGIAGLLAPNAIVVSSPTIGSPALSQKQSPSALQLALSSPSFASSVLQQKHVFVAASFACGSATFGTPAATSATFSFAPNNLPQFNFVAVDLNANSPVLGRPSIISRRTGTEQIVVSTGLLPLYDPELDIWPDLAHGRVLLAPVRVGVDRRTGKMLIGWDHVVQSLEVMFVTRYHERVLRRWVGTLIPMLLGDNATSRNIARFYWAIITGVDLWEPNFRIQRVNVDNRRSDNTSLTSAEELRAGHLTVQTFGVYRPRAHLGDPTPETRRSIGLVGRGYGVWNRA